MKAHTASLINAISLIVLAGWGYFSSDASPVTALIPVGVGIALLACNPGVKKENKVVAHVAVVLTLVILLGLIKPLTGAIDRGDGLAIARVVGMISTTIFAMVFFIRSFIEARKKREAAGG